MRLGPINENGETLSEKTGSMRIFISPLFIKNVEWPIQIAASVILTLTSLISRNSISNEAGKSLSTNHLTVSKIDFLCCVPSEL
tara:strand:- start:4332 stop:4583 length:252 start_codon:yes stop_codon:yes gene_type:complete